MQVPAGDDWFGWIKTEAGDGAATVTDGVLNCSSGAGTGSAKLARYLTLRPLDQVTFRVMARRLSGSDDTSGGIAFDRVTSIKNRVRVRSGQWQEYALHYVAPHDWAPTDYLAINCGVFTADGGEVEFAWPRLEVKEAMWGALRTIACGLILMDDGTPVINASWVNCGIEDLAYSAADKKLTVTLANFKTTASLGLAPMIFANVTNFSNPKLVAKPGGYVHAAGTFEIQWADMTTGAFVDVASLGDFFTFVEVRG